MTKRDELTALDPAKTVSCPTFRRVSNPNGPTRREIWEATSADGVWTYIREESPGTPWLIRHNPSDRIAYMAGSLPKARRATAAGWALNSLNRAEAS